MKLLPIALAALNLESMAEFIVFLMLIGAITFFFYMFCDIWDTVNAIYKHLGLDQKDGEK